MIDGRGSAWLDVVVWLSTSGLGLGWAPEKKSVSECSMRRRRVCVCVCAGVHRSVFGGGRVMGKKRGTSITVYRVGGFVGGWGNTPYVPATTEKTLQIL